MRESLNELLKTGAYTVLDAYLKVCADCEEYGTLELWEFKNYISDYAVENGKIFGYTQMTIFDV